MGQLSDVLQPDELARIKNLQVMAKQVVEGVITGMHRSPHKGFSVEFAQHRQYTHGDEIRRLDWKVFGKTDRLYVREYEEETNLRATVLLDMSGSMGYAGEGRKSKFEYAVRLTACLAYLLLQQRDRTEPGQSKQHIDAAAMNFVRKPQDFDVVVASMAWRCCSMAWGLTGSYSHSGTNGARRGHF